VFIPYYNDGPRDHWATTRIVRRALRACRPGIWINEYPVWFWYHWPWTRLEGRLRQRLNSLRESWEFSRCLLRDFRCSVRVGAVLDQKRAALAQHRSQVERLVDDPNWRTLGEVSGGDFLDCFFQEREIFYRHHQLHDPPTPTIPW
jgi:LmbE family N-acetylglucosaminyl deacetylase